ncbi:pantoate--beta-alanine ligase [Gulosibacter chungangensis]|uniref:Pantothenate synthetase n=1 Tax=Gulosibacter chungangensis TaxID=979746 RepID=A0A7J5B7K5_9MICO|nr:pantoate--beta-alanine ligase [Gulosibacter chungangensis]
MKTVVETKDALAKIRGAQKATGRIVAGRIPVAAKKLALVPTMGALHDGHRALIKLAKENADYVIVSLFVNPLQFGPNEDFDEYPRPLEQDLAVLEEEGVDYVFAPEIEDMYGDLEDVTIVSAGAAGRILEGEFRPTHFDGVLTVVAKLFNIIRPDFACFGEKDAQQLALVRRMVRDLNFPLDILAAPIARETDGLARSSRNVYLESEDREAALALSGALAAVAEAASEGVEAALAAGREIYERQPLASMDYLELVDAATFAPLSEGFTGKALALTAARIGQTRLIDNRRVTF